MKAVRQFVPSPVVALAAMLGSVAAWCWVGELRWKIRPRGLRMSTEDRALVFGTMNLLQAFATCLALFAVLWMVLAIWKRRSRWRVAVLALSVLTFLLSFVP